VVDGLADGFQLWRAPPPGLSYRTWYRKFLLDCPGAAVPVHSVGRPARAATAPLAHSAEHSPRKGKVHGSNP
jgi:hypothetical protein